MCSKPSLGVSTTLYICCNSSPAQGRGRRSPGCMFHHLKPKPTVQGVSTTLYAATAPGLKGQGGAYLVDCAVAQPSRTCQDMDTVRSWLRWQCIRPGTAPLQETLLVERSCAMPFCEWSSSGKTQLACRRVDSAFGCRVRGVPLDGSLQIPILHIAYTALTVACAHPTQAAKLWEVTAEQVAAAESPGGFKG
jgi:hypothetical protein